MDESITRNAARLLAKAEILHNHDELYDEEQFSGADIGLPNDEYIVVKYFRRKVKRDRLQELYVATPIPVYETEGA